MYEGNVIGKVIMYIKCMITVIFIVSLSNHGFSENELQALIVLRLKVRNVWGGEKKVGDPILG